MEAQVMSKKKQLICLTVVFVLLGLTAYFLFKDQELSKLPGLLAGVDMRYMLLGVLSILTFFALEGRGLQILLRPLVGRLNYFTVCRYAFIDFYFSAITPACSGGQPSQLFFMHRDHIPFSASSLALLTFNMAYHVAALLLAAGVIVCSGFGIMGDMGAFKYLLIFGILAQLAMVLFYTAAIFHKKLAAALARGVVNILCKVKLVRNGEAALDKVNAQIEEYRRGAEYLKQNPLLLLRTMAIALCHLLALYAVPFWIYKAFGLSGTSVWTLIAVQTALTMSVESLPIPGGIGVTESGFMLIYAGIFGESLVLPALLLCRGLNYYFGLLTGGVISAISFSHPLRLPVKTPLCPGRSKQNMTV